MRPKPRFNSVTDIKGEMLATPTPATPLGRTRGSHTHPHPRHPLRGMASRVLVVPIGDTSDVAGGRGCRG